MFLSAGAKTSLGVFRRMRLIMKRQSLFPVDFSTHTKYWCIGNNENDDENNNDKCFIS